jgi:hypothetical protein
MERALESRSGRVILLGGLIAGGPLALAAARRSRSSMKLPLEELRERLGRRSRLGLRRLAFRETSEGARLCTDSFPFSLWRVAPGVVGVVGMEESIPSETILA